jgi:dephospho-CoA kinase
MEVLDPATACKKWGIVLTGGIGSGKSTVSLILQSIGYLVIDADQLSRDIFVPGHIGFHSVVDIFGIDILDDSGLIKRDLLRKKAFATPQKKQQLESITHPLIAKELELKLKEKQILKSPRIWFYEAPVIIEAQRHLNFLDVWLTVCPKQQRVRRISLRDQIVDLQANKNIDLQLTDNYKAKYASFIIDTYTDLDSLKYSILHALAYRVPGNHQNSQKI